MKFFVIFLLLASLILTVRGLNLLTRDVCPPHDKIYIACITLTMMVAAVVSGLILVLA